jgi:hypothetical protein
MNVLTKHNAEVDCDSARWNNRFGWTLYLISWETKQWKNYIKYRLKNR